MEIAFIPQFIIKKIASDYYKQNDYNLLISNLLIILLFIFLGNSLMQLLNSIPHFCLIDKLIRVECPVCGITRAFCELSIGNVSNAYALNRTSVLVASFILIQIPLRVFAISNIVSSIKINFISKYFSIIILAIIFINWILKMITNH